MGFDPFIIKVCGMTTVDDARAALDAGVNWIGLNLVGGPRQIGLPDALQIIQSLEDASAAVALVSMDAPGDDIDQLLRGGVRRLQLYGDVSPEFLEDLTSRGTEPILVRPIGSEAQLAETAALLGTCAVPPRYVLVDAYVAGQKGGTGQAADWEALRAARGCGQLANWPPILLAGGLTPQNVTDAIRTVRPAGVDVSSGVELRPGKKDAAKVRAFVHAARTASGNL